MNKHFVKKVGVAAAVAMGALAASQGHAADWSTITGGIDFSGEETAIQAVTGLIAGVTIVIFGGRKVISMFGR